MKRFLLFAGDSYYPSHGWEDFRNSFDTPFTRQITTTTNRPIKLMSNQRYNPTYKQPPVSLNPVKPGEIPKELAELDGQALCATTPGENQIPTTGTTGAPVAGDSVEQSEFNLHSDGALAKYDNNPGKPPTQLVCDGAGRVFCVARNPDVADLICNSLNYFHAASVKLMFMQQEEARKAAEAAGPSIIIDPTSGGNIILPPGSNN